MWKITIFRISAQTYKYICHLLFFFHELKKEKAVCQPVYNSYVTSGTAKEKAMRRYYIETLDSPPRRIQSPRRIFSCISPL
jgi:hypothetical protein